ncbi:phage terminase large subunit family protein [Vibrio fluvialis]|uniref:terminase gpA endonuclease subunit n=1 Tax=Vibrio fluvialis TaxID=676 RepID=UPI001EEC90A2|nr:terminase gpA endonuclease subunit [Vibrio fluvialis]MCG6357011.1 phage terminase large subunit family protein [Vibrio fluvialis]
MAALRREAPIKASEWANKHFRLAAGSSQEEGFWETLPLQVVPLNMMCNRAITEIAFQKSARVGWTKLIVAADSCLHAQFKTNSAIYVPTESDAKNLSVSEIDAAWQEMPIMHRIFPALFAKDQNNTTNYKKGIGWALHILGTSTPRNMRALTKGAVFGDEIDGWDWEVGKEGNPLDLVYKRLEGAAFPMARWGTTPTNKGESHIERLMARVELTFRFYLPCPHCGTEQVLEWGSKETKYGFKWDHSQPTLNAKAKSVYYECIGCDDHILYQHLYKMELAGRWMAEDGMWTKDGHAFFDEAGNPAPTPTSVGIHIWSGYNTKLSEGWRGIVKEFLKKKDDPTRLKTFVNLSLGELWEGENGDKLDWEVLKLRREIWWSGKRVDNPVPDRAVVLTGGIDTQDDRIEMFVWAWGAGEECWLVSHIVLLGDLSTQVLKDAAGRMLYQTYKKRSGEAMDVKLWCWDAMGHKTDDVYEMSRRYGVMWVIPIQGENQYGKPIQNFPRKKNNKKVYLTRLGTDGIKQRLYSRLSLMPNGTEPVPGCIHFPLDDELANDEFFKQLCSAAKKLEYDKSGREVWRWLKQYHAFDEALDGWNYAYAALNILVQKFGLALDEPQPIQTVSKPASSGIAALAERLRGGKS